MLFADLPQPVLVAAPMAEITDSAFRVTAFRAGADVCVTEMVSSAGLLHDSPGSHVLLEQLPEESGKPVIAQLYGGNAEELAEAARRIAALGRFCAIDLNAGCPAPKVVRCGGGSALLEDLPRLEAILKAMVKAVAPFPVTVKTRIGPNPQKNLAVCLAKLAEDAGAAVLTLHGRFTSAFHSGPVNAAAIRSAVEAVHLPVWANGGVQDAAGALALLRNSGAAGLMIGRGAVGRPWLFGAIRSAGEAFPSNADIPPSGEELSPEVAVQALREHLALSLALKKRHAASGFMKADFSPEHALCLDFRRFFFTYLRGLPGAVDLRRKLVQINTLQDIEGALDGFLSHR